MAVPLPPWLVTGHDWLAASGCLTLITFYPLGTERAAGRFGFPVTHRCISAMEPHLLACDVCSGMLVVQGTSGQGSGLLANGENFRDPNMFPSPSSYYPEILNVCNSS